MGSVGEFVFSCPRHAHTPSPPHSNPEGRIFACFFVLFSFFFFQNFNIASHRIHRLNNLPPVKETKGDTLDGNTQKNPLVIM